MKSLTVKKFNFVPIYNRNQVFFTSGRVKLVLKASSCIEVHDFKFKVHYAMDYNESTSVLVGYNPINGERVKKQFYIYYNDGKRYSHGGCTDNIDI